MSEAQPIEAMSVTEGRDEGATAAEIIRWAESRGERLCGSCSRRLCTHELLVQLALGTGQEPRCIDCTARLLGRERSELLESLRGFIVHRDCRREAWLWASAREGYPSSDRPPCLWPAGPPPGLPVATEAAQAAGIPSGTCERWDAGALGCGELVLELRLRLRRLGPGAVLHLVATDPGAPEDLPAWCRLTGNRLLEARPPNYWVARGGG